MSTELYGLLSTATPNLCIDHEDGGKEQVHLNNQIATLAVALDMVKEQFHDQLEAIQDVVNKMENTLRQLSDHHQHQQPAVSMATPFSVPTHMPMSPPMVTTPGHEDTDDFFRSIGTHRYRCLFITTTCTINSSCIIKSRTTIITNHHNVKLRHHDDLLGRIAWSKCYTTFKRSC